MMSAQASWMKAAIRWLRAHSELYHLDGERSVAWGGSSGDNSAAMVCLTAGGDLPAPEPPKGKDAMVQL
jgi:acetyl esterase/lipase